MFILSVYASCISNQCTSSPEYIPTQLIKTCLKEEKDNQVLIFVQVRVISVVKVLATQNSIKSYFQL